MSVISKGRHDIVIKQEGKISGGFFKVTKKMHPMYPFHEDKLKCDDYGEIIKPEDYKLADVNPDGEENKENILIKKEEEEISKYKFTYFLNIIFAYLSLFPETKIQSLIVRPLDIILNKYKYR